MDLPYVTTTKTAPNTENAAAEAAAEAAASRPQAPINNSILPPNGSSAGSDPQLHPLPSLDASAGELLHRNYDHDETFDSDIEDTNAVDRVAPRRRDAFDGHRRPHTCDDTFEFEDGESGSVISINSDSSDDCDHSRLSDDVHAAHRRFAGLDPNFYPENTWPESHDKGVSSGNSDGVEAFGQSRDPSEVEADAAIMEARASLHYIPHVDAATIRGLMAAHNTCPNSSVSPSPNYEHSYYAFQDGDGAMGDCETDDDDNGGVEGEMQRGRLWAEMARELPDAISAEDTQNLTMTGIDFDAWMAAHATLESSFMSTDTGPLASEFPTPLGQSHANSNMSPRPALQEFAESQLPLGEQQQQQQPPPHDLTNDAPTPFQLVETSPGECPSADWLVGNGNILEDTDLRHPRTLSDDVAIIRETLDTSISLVSQLIDGLSQIWAKDDEEYAEIDRLVGELESEYNTLVNILVQELNSLQEHIRSQAVNIDTVRSENTSLRDRLAHLTTCVDASQNTIRDLEASCRRQALDYESKLKAASDEHREVQRSVEKRHSDEMARLRTQYEQRISDLDNLSSAKETELQQVRAEFERIKDEYRVALDQLGYAHDVQRNEQRRQELEVAVQDLRDRLAAANARAARAEGHEALVVTERRQFQRQISDLLESTRRAETLEAQFAEQREESHAKLTEFKKENQRLREKAVAYECQVVSLTSTNKRLARQIATCKCRVGMLREQVGALELASNGAGNSARARRPSTGATIPVTKKRRRATDLNVNPELATITLRRPPPTPVQQQPPSAGAADADVSAPDRQRASTIDSEATAVNSTERPRAVTVGEGVAEDEYLFFEWSGQLAQRRRNPRQAQLSATATAVSGPASRRVTRATISTPVEARGRSGVSVTAASVAARQLTGSRLGTPTTPRIAAPRSTASPRKQSMHALTLVQTPAMSKLAGRSLAAGISTTARKHGAQAPLAVSATKENNNTIGSLRKRPATSAAPAVPSRTSNILGISFDGEGGFKRRPIVHRFLSKPPL